MLLQIFEAGTLREIVWKLVEMADPIFSVLPVSETVT